MVWSAPAFWTTALFKKSDWQAKWIGLDKNDALAGLDSLIRPLPARMLRKEFSVNKKVKRATAFISGLGLFELYLNGQKIGDQVLAPALSEYDKRTYYMTFDVSENLTNGENAVGVILGNGRYFAPRTDAPAGTKTYGYPKLLLQINIEYMDGSSETVYSDESWKLTTDGPIIANNEYDGEIYDARKEIAGWNQAGFDDSGWPKVELVKKPGKLLRAQPNEPIKITETIKPVKISKPKQGMFIFDMGQNMVGWVKIKVKGEKGTKIKLRFAEALKDDGTLYLDNIRGAKVTDIYILKGGAEEEWQPRFTYHGFRYVELSGYPGKADLSTIEGEVVHDALERSGEFTTSNEMINQIYKNAVWGIRGNYRSMPTDCPQRDERQGWLGDRSVESRGESFIHNIFNLYRKWLTDMYDAQLENGSISDVAPSYWPFYSDNVTWPGSFIVIPEMLFEQYGDTATIRFLYPGMKKWITHMSTYIKDDIMPRDTYGDWCVPPQDRKSIHSSDPERITSGELIGTGYFYHELKLMEHYAVLLGQDKDAALYRGQAENMKIAFNRKFLDTDNVIYGNNTQTANVLPLAFGLVPPKYHKKIFNNLIDNIMGKSGGHIGTGLIGAQWLMRVLTQNGRADVAYKLASQTSYPSWGYMVKKGATTIWELWNGDTGNPAMNSRNHVMLLGDLIVWFYENLAGIKSDMQNPGFKHIIMKPEPVKGLTSVETSYHSIRGKISSKWQVKNNEFYWDITIPANTSATVYIPAKNEKVVYESGAVAGKAEGVTFIRMEGKRAVYQVESGNYSFISAAVSFTETQKYAEMPQIIPGDTTVIDNRLQIKMNCEEGGRIYYTFNGAEPTERATLYDRPVWIFKPSVLKARVYRKGFHHSVTKSVFYDFIKSGINGVAYKLYLGSFKKIPDMRRLKPAETGTAFKINLNALKVPQENFALSFKGYIDIGKSGKYTFYLSSNDGSKLYLDNKLLIDNDGEHGPAERSRELKLTKGRHPVKVDYFQSGGGKMLQLYYKGPGITRKEIPGSVLYLKDK
jgi:alpha-L-rhamnosidase